MQLYNAAAMLVVFLPLLSASICGLFGRAIGKERVHYLSCGLLAISAVLSWIMLIFYVNEYVITINPWISVGSFSANWAIYVDKLTCIMFVVVNSVSLMVHIYSIGYMSEDSDQERFFSYLSLFTFFMLLLISSDNFIQLFCGWEGVGLCSYLLIGFWFQKNSANLASMKAFIVNRIGDFGLALGICLIFVQFGTVEFKEIFQSIYDERVDFDVNLLCMLLFVGCMGKSAQLGLHTWLPDAMEGPTPVSALIHAATMVTAGVFLIARCYPLFELAQVVKSVILVVGAATSIFAASIAIVQTDIKKIIAYSTCSQLGYMFMSCGAGDYSAAIFHLVTHAFFKALLFLGAGSIIYLSHHEQNIYSLKCDWRRMPASYISMWIGSLALGGFFPFAGFYSKDLVIEALHASSSNFAHVIALFVACLTVIYSWRVIIVVFHQPDVLKCELGKDDDSRLPKSMLFPLVFLIIMSCAAGLGGYKWLIDIPNQNSFLGYSAFWGRVINVNTYENVTLVEKFKPLFLSFAGLLVSYVASPLIFGKRLSVFKMLELSTLVVILTAAISPFVTFVGFLVFLLFRFTKFAHSFLLNHWYFNQIYDYLFVIPVRCLGCILWQFVDMKCIDNVGPNGVARLSNMIALKLSNCYSGRVLDYGLFIICVVGLMLTLVVLF